MNSPLPRPAADSGAEIAALRKNLRNARIAAREQLPAAERQALTARIEAHLDALLAHLAPTRLAFCWPWRNEVDLVPWMNRWLAADATRRAALPVVRNPGQPMAFLRWTPDAAMDTDHHDIPIPADGERLEPDLILVPLNVFDAAGYRLGYGGGYFDRTLAALDPLPVCVGVAFELARTETVYPQPHDQPMDWIVTEAGAAQATGRTLSA
ncbi:MAG: 5-formyltetrahydrofolate cyclo-ligase [Zoogloea oleivorans]|uniref:5-formyltetrahydrofolate cyclo-ligase n=1 Tax=Zoogloea oleivorans TaxID=1552750 RepID=UPI002A36F5D4|nr:5-formyltetrahydrofolate cyclo-ligase [Zoogloea oleivorans]MDY0034853.1 5-formyltetrahydrofolate cyclo-ligase [Zoogloea oleivorans]